ncbi:uncharacterized protein JCM6883_005092 [Sporobolomyces salmoneus]|uniref:uncharacterized protein n=1 Tax=Sporobolomyces salmoneus TaxID=183962 RepID=UPI0031801122
MQDVIEADQPKWEAMSKYFNACLDGGDLDAAGRTVCKAFVDSENSASYATKHEDLFKCYRYYHTTSPPVEPLAQMNEQTQILSLALQNSFLPIWLALEPLAKAWVEALYQKKYGPSSPSPHGFSDALRLQLCWFTFNDQESEPIRHIASDYGHIAIASSLKVVCR